MAVHVLQRQEQLHKPIEHRGRVWAELGLGERADMRRQIAAAGVLHDDVQLTLAHERVLVPDYVGMIERRQDVDFAFSNFLIGSTHVQDGHTFVHHKVTL